MTLLHILIIHRKEKSGTFFRFNEYFSKKLNFKNSNNNNYI